MCKFLSAIVRPDGSIYADPEHTDSHEDLVFYLGLVDDGSPIASRTFCRVEFTPPDEIAKIDDLSAWMLRVDEESAPPWYDGAAVRARLEERVKAMFVRDTRKLLLGGCWILVGEANVFRVRSARIVTLLGSSQVGALYGSSQVGELHGSSRVGALHGSSRVGALHGSSQVGKLHGSSQVGELWDSSQVGELWDSSQVGELHGSSQVGKLHGSSQVGKLWDSSQVGELCTDGECKPTIGADKRDKKESAK
jgi:hypothetical protein